MESKYIELMDELKDLKSQQKQRIKEAEIAYDYKESLLSKMKFADSQILTKQKDVHTVSLLIADKLAMIKIDLDLYAKS